MKFSLKSDIPASIVVFLVALPLCLGVALASGAPLLSGIISGIMGGIVVGLLSQSHTSVSGPAAGMAAVVLAAITKLGSFEIFLVAVVVAGFLQFILGIIKGGIIASYIPSNVIKGLLAAIGIILILKQIPHAVGFDRDTEDDFSFIQRDGENTFSELLNIFDYFSWGAILVSVISILVLIYWKKTPLGNIKFLPASLIVVVLGVLINAILIKYFPTIAISPDHLVKIPKFEGIEKLIVFPDFSQIMNKQIWIIAITITIVASLESLLNLEAVENIDPLKRKASPNQELIAQGIGNMCSGLIGGIPITSVIVRSSVNLNAGASSKLSSILHGVFLLISVVLLVDKMNLIPLSSLAAILILTGYKLADVKLFKDMYNKGFNQFIPFIATIIAIVFTDLLIGVLLGLAISIFFLIKNNYKNPFVVSRETQHIDETIRIELPNQVSFFNKSSIKEVLWNIAPNSKLIIDCRYSEYIDNDILELIEDFKNTVSKEKSIKLNILGLQNKYQLNDHIQFVNVLDKEAQQKMSPDQILNILKNGNDRFLKGESTEKYLTQQVNATSEGQNPFAIILSCIDSRTTTEHIFDLGLGDIFSIRIAGNIVNPDILGSMEFGVHVKGVKLIVVLGHTNCGAIVGACDHVELGNLSTLLHKVGPAIERETTVLTQRNGSNDAFVDKVSAINIEVSIENIRKESELIRNLESEGKIKIVGALYNVETGRVIFY